MKFQEQLMIPFKESEKRMISQLNKWDDSSNYLFKENIPFEDEMELVEVSRGRSACDFHMKSKISDIEYVFNYSAFSELIKSGYFSGKNSKGLFSFRKRGASYTCQPHIINNK